MDPAPSQLPAAHLRNEQVRLRSHFSTVLGELAGRDFGGLSTEQRHERGLLIAYLREYRAAGRFPANTDFPGESVPYLRDRFGTSCAMAYLIERAGDAPLVDALAAQDNNVRIDSIEGGPLLAWLDRHGLSQDEAARIQPSYDYLPPPQLPPSLPPGGAPITQALPGVEVLALTVLAVAAISALSVYLMLRRMDRASARSRIVRVGRRIPVTGAAPRAQGLPRLRAPPGFRTGP